eukprot:4669301-Pyramimonas_sp.AAC.1
MPYSSGRVPAEVQKGALRRPPAARAARDRQRLRVTIWTDAAGATRALWAVGHARGQFVYAMLAEPPCAWLSLLRREDYQIGAQETSRGPIFRHFPSVPSTAPRWFAAWIMTALGPP